MPMGPFELLDEIGLDVGVHVLKSLSQAQAHGLSLPAAVEQAVAKGWLGSKSGKGFYLHEKAKKRGKERRPRLNDEMANLIARSGTSPGTGTATVAPSQEHIQWRLVLPMVNEAAHVLDGGITDSADDIDLATVLGLGFAPFRGGLAKFVEDAGMQSMVRRLEEHEVRHGPRFSPPEFLRDLAREGGVFPRPGPGARPRQPQELNAGR
jgi:3-hydroxyacyl-CoA dehydrogenase